MAKQNLGIEGIVLIIVFLILFLFIAKNGTPVNQPRYSGGGYKAPYDPYYGMSYEERQERQRKAISKIREAKSILADLEYELSYVKREIELAEDQGLSDNLITDMKQYKDEIKREIQFEEGVIQEAMMWT
jgi:hypothetical protein